MGILTHAINNKVTKKGKKWTSLIRGLISTQNEMGQIKVTILTLNITETDPDRNYLTGPASNFYFLNTH